jgi:hypothetical protein
MDINNILLVIILIILLINTVLLCMHNCKPKAKEGYFEVDRLSTRVGPYEGPTFCSGIGVRNVADKNRPIGDDSFLFNK